MRSHEAIKKPLMLFGLLLIIYGISSFIASYFFDQNLLVVLGRIVLVLTFHFRFIVILRRMELPKKYEDYEAYSKGALETQIHDAAAHSYVLLYARVIAPVNSIQPAFSL